MSKVKKIILLTSTALLVALVVIKAIVSSPVVGYSVVTGYEKTLRVSITPTQTTIPVTSLTLKDGSELSMAELGDRVFLSLEPGTAREEIVMCTDINTSTISFTSCTRGLAFSGSSTDTVANNRKSHNAGGKVVMSNVHYAYQQFLDITGGEQTVNGLKTFSDNLNINGELNVGSLLYLGDDTPDDNKSILIRNGGANSPFLRYNEGINTWQWSPNGIDSYDFASSAFTVLTASTTKGIGIADSQIFIKASSTKGLAFDNDGLLYIKTDSSTSGLDFDPTTGLFTSVSLLIDAGVASTTPTANTIPVADGDGLINNWITKDYTQTKMLISETVSKGDALYVSTGNSTVKLYETSGYQTSVSLRPPVLTKLGQTFTTSNNTIKISTIYFSVEEAWGHNSFNGSIAIYNTDGGLPTGSPLWTGEFKYKGQLFPGVPVYPNIDVNASTMYAFVVWTDDTTDKQVIAEKTNISIPGGTWIQSTDNGITYTTSTGAMRSAVYTVEGTPGGIYKTTALTDIDKVNNFIGFAATDAVTSSYTNVITSGIWDGFSGLSVGQKYYLSNDFGKISTTPGTKSKEVGLSISSNSLLIKNDN